MTESFCYFRSIIILQILFVLCELSILQLLCSPVRVVNTSISLHNTPWSRLTMMHWGLIFREFLVDLPDGEDLIRCRPAVDATGLVKGQTTENDLE